MVKSSPTKDAPQKLICENRKARGDYAIGERFEAGLVLTGTEVKSCREGKAHLNDAYVNVHKGEAFLVNGHIAEYHHGNAFNHAPTRQRKLLLHKAEIAKLDTSIRQKGMTVVPLKLYFKDGKIKVEIGLGKGKTHEDRREDIKAKDTKRELERMMRRRR